MKRFFCLIVTALVVAAASGCATPNLIAPATSSDSHKTSGKTLRAFSSQQELEKYFRQLAEEQKRERGRSVAQESTTTTAATPQASTNSAAAKAGAKDADDSVTNVQQAGVDEGGIVKLHGDHLVVLRRGRLFTVAIGGGALKPISEIDAFGPDIDPRGTWYDEMLISGDTIAVIGYSYERGGTEVGLFQIDRAGNLRFLSTYHLRSNDYYSSRNYASRLIGNKLIFYTPLYLSPEDESLSKTMPAVRKWHKGATASEFRSIITPTRIYRTEHPIHAANGLALHTVTVCDIAQGEMSCKATAVVGAPGRVFYVSPDAVYVWTTDWASYGNEKHSPAMLYRMPLDGTAPSALQVSGSPVDQFSFLESDDHYLNVLVRSDAAGDGMWSAEVAAGDVALMRAPVESFSDGNDVVPTSNYRKLPKPEGYTFQNRFVGDYLLYGTGSGWGYPEKANGSSLYLVRWTNGDLTDLHLAHGVDRIEVMGSGAVVVGTDGQDLHFTSVRLNGRPAVVSSYVRKDASQGESRSQGFFYKADGPDSGLLGLPVRGGGRPGYEQLAEGSASILFLRNDALHLTEVGDLSAKSERAVNDACRASCVDWYGNARPLFVRGRVFALLGYEIVEGHLTDGRIRELRRVNFAPQRLEASKGREE